jgi:uncharacterized protein
MLLKLLIVIALIVIVYRASKSWFGQNDENRRRASTGRGEHIDDDMVQDPQCGIYFPRRQAIHLRENGRDLLFCSEKCRQSYVAAHGEHHS